MKTKRFFFAAFLALGIFIIPPASAAKKKKEVGAAGTKGLFLFDGASGQAAPVDGKPRPNRIYVRFSPEFNDWVFVLSDLYGRFPDPMEVLVAGSVTSGESIGAAGGRYVFQPGGRWISTTEPRRLRYIVLGEIPSYKTVFYEPATESRIEFVNPAYQFNFQTYDPFANR